MSRRRKLTGDEHRLAVTFGRIVREARKRAHMTQRNVGAGVNLSPSAFSAIDRGERVPSLSLVFGLARELHMSTGELISLVANELPDLDATRNQHERAGLGTQRRFGESVSDDELARIVDQGGLQARIAGELLARRAGDRQRSRPLTG
jgi:transcriptional regulator with XRE-family HTH domain